MMSPTANVIPMGGSMEEEPQDKANMVPTRVPPPGYDCSAEYCEVLWSLAEWPQTDVGPQSRQEAQEGREQQGRSLLGRLPRGGTQFDHSLITKARPPMAVGEAARTLRLQVAF